MATSCTIKIKGYGPFIYKSSDSFPETLLPIINNALVIARARNDGEAHILGGVLKKLFKADIEYDSSLPEKNRLIMECGTPGMAIYPRNVTIGFLSYRYSINPEDYTVEVK